MDLIEEFKRSTGTFETVVTNTYGDTALQYSNPNAAADYAAYLARLASNQSGQ